MEICRTCHFTSKCSFKVMLDCECCHLYYANKEGMNTSCDVCNSCEKWKYCDKESQDKCQLFRKAEIIDQWYPYFHNNKRDKFTDIDCLFDECKEGFRKEFEKYQNFLTNPIPKTTSKLENASNGLKRHIAQRHAELFYGLLIQCHNIEQMGVS